MRLPSAPAFLLGTFLQVGFPGTVPSRAEEIPLPERVDHTVSPHFPPVITQVHESCAQDAGISTMMTYEWNRLRGTAASDPKNRFAGRFLWNFLNGGENRGTELAEGWHLARAMGVPTEVAYSAGAQGPLGAWPNGYALYHDAMQHRLRGYHFAPLATEEDLERAKRWLYERGEERRRPGGVLAIEGRLRGCRQIRISPGEFEAGKALVLRWGRRGAGHVMTYAGYDDRVGHDVNGDGRLTRDVDLDGDGALTLADWETGAFIAVNSYGPDWGDGGKSYVLFRESAVTPFQRGRWAAAIDVWPEYRPRLTLRLTLQTACQAALRLRIAPGEGSGEMDAEWFSPAFLEGDVPLEKPPAEASPERYSRLVTGERRLSLGPARADGEGRSLPVEVGIDLTGRLPAAASSFALEFRLDPQAAGEAWTPGVLWEAHVRRYGADGALEDERPFEDLPARIGAEPRRVRSALDPG